MIGSDFGNEKFPVMKRCSECGEKIRAHTMCLVSRNRDGKNKKIVCSEHCRLDFDDRFWQGRADLREFKEGDGEKKNDQAKEKEN